MGAIIALVPARWRDQTLQWWIVRPYACGSAAMVLLWLLHLAITGNHPWKLVQGEEGRASTSKFQFWLWTVVAAFAYVVFTVARIKQKTFAPIDTFLPGLLLAIGFSSTTAVAAKGTTSSYVSSGRVAKPTATGGQSVSDLISDDSGSPDLVKFQMLAWTFVAVGNLPGEPILVSPKMELAGDPLYAYKGFFDVCIRAHDFAQGVADAFEVWTAVQKRETQQILLLPKQQLQPVTPAPDIDNAQLKRVQDRLDAIIDSDHQYIGPCSNRYG